MKKLLLLLFCGTAAFGQTNLDDLFEVAKLQNYTLKNSSLQRELATITTKIAGLNAFNPRVPVSYQAIDNLALQKTYVPGEIFGQPAGTQRELVMGMKYVSTFSFQPQFDILNFGNRAQRKSAVLNEESAVLTQRQTQRDIYLQINSAYHNILSFDAQGKILNDNLAKASTILEIMRNRQQEGIARIQDVNEAEVNVISIQDKIYQVEQNTELQYELLKVLMGSQNKPVLTDVLKWDTPDLAFARGESSLERQVAGLRKDIAGQDVYSAKRDQWPVLSFVSSFNWQNLDNSFFYGSGSNGIYYAFAGLKLTWDLPTNVQKISNLKNREIQYKMAQNTAELVDEQQDSANIQREIELRKAQNQWGSLKKIEELKRDTFEKNFAQFEEEVLPLDKLLISQNDLLLSQLNLVTGAAAVKYNYQILRINNLY